MSKKLFNQGFILFVAGILVGAFYREYTKYVGFTGITSLSLTHTHLLAPGAMIAFIFAALLKAYNIRESKSLNIAWLLYIVGVLGNAIVLFTRGMFTISAVEISYGLTKAISGISGLLHIAMTVGIIWFLLQVKKEINLSE